MQHATVPTHLYGIIYVMSPKIAKTLDILAALIVIVVLVWAAFSFINGQAVFDLILNNPERFSDYFREAGPWAEILFVAVVITELLIAFIPGWFVYPVGGALFGLWPAFGLVVLGNLIGASIGFWIGRKFGTPLLRKFISKEYIERFDLFVQAHGTKSIFFLKINPITSFDIFNYLAGASPIKFWKFTVANLMGITPLILAAALLGDELLAAAPQLLGAMILLTLLYILWFIINIPRRISRARKKAAAKKLLPKE